MISINANRADPFSRALTGGYKWYDELGIEAYLRYYMSNTWSVLASAASNTTQPASNGRFVTLRGVDFSWVIWWFPTFPNGNSTIIDQQVTNTTKGISVTNTLAVLTNQRFIVNYLFPKKLFQPTLEFIEYNIPLNCTASPGNGNFTAITVNIRLKKVDKAGTITTIFTNTPTVASQSNATVQLNGIFTNITGLNDEDILFIELDASCTIQLSNLGAFLTFWVTHAQNSSSFLLLS